MKYLDKLINFIFSLVILVVSVVIVLVTAGFIEDDIVYTYMSENIFSEANNTITCIVAIVVFFAALKTTIFLSKTNTKKKAAIMVDTTHGKIQIAQETIENTAKSVVKNYQEVKDAQVRMVKDKKAVNVYMSLLVLPNTNIIELSSKVQDEVKEAIQNTTGVKVNNVDIKIKNIADSRNASKTKTTGSEKQEIVLKTEPMNVINDVNNSEDVEKAVEESVETNNNVEETSVENNEENKNE